MKADLAAVNCGPEPFSVDRNEISLATIDDKQVMLAAQTVGVGGSDLHPWTAQQSWQGKYPVVLGHKFCGTICPVAKNVQGWREGDRVDSETATVADPSNRSTLQGLHTLDPSHRRRQPRKAMTPQASQRGPGG